ncbi:hypothetical protein GCM10028791_19370 [Echinicola sediminis]
MKKIIILAVFSIISITSFAQKEGDKRYDREKLEAAKVAFITQRLDIKPEQATAFWPLYNQFEENRRKSHMKLRATSRINEQDLTAEKARELVQEKFKIQQQLLDEEKAFIDKIKDILTPIQIYKLGEADRDFVRHLYKMNRDRKRPREDNP